MRPKIPIKTAPELSVDLLLRSSSVCVRDVYCRGTCREHSAEEHATATALVFSYRGTYVRQLGQDQAVAEANQVLFFNNAEGYRISHPVAGGDASLSLAISPALLLELAPVDLLHNKSTAAFRHQRLRIDARAQSLVAMLRHSLRQNIAEPLEAEGLGLDPGAARTGTTHNACCWR
jgi:AraC family transcriptional regulator